MDDDNVATSVGEAEGADTDDEDDDAGMDEEAEAARDIYVDDDAEAEKEAKAKVSTQAFPAQCDPGVCLIGWIAWEQVLVLEQSSIGAISIEES